MPRAILPVLLVLAPVLTAAAQEGYYAVPPGVLEFRLVHDGGPQEPPGGTVEYPDTAGKTARVERTPLVTGDDIEGILVDRTREGDRDVWQITVDFQRTSWGRIRSATRRLIGRRVALVHDGKILLGPVVRGAVTTEAQTVAADEDVPWLRPFLARLKRVETPPSRDQRKEAYRALLEKTFADNPQDVEALDELSAENLWSGDYDHALELFEKLVRLAPSRAGRLNVLLDRLEAGKEYDKAIRCCKLLRQAEPGTAWSARYRAARIYRAQGDRPSAVAELEAGLMELRFSPLTPSRRTELIQTFTKELGELK
jgi:cytochrome c-type biogenesis protein CcmH/NrfG